MASNLPKKEFFTPSDIREFWNTTYSDLRHWLVSGYLCSHAWLPLTSVYAGMDNDPDTIEPEKPIHLEGYIRISGSQCYRLFRQGFILIREFVDADCGKRFRLPGTADDFPVYLDDLVILESEQIRFEREYGLRREQAQINATAGISKDWDFTPSFRKVRIAGRGYSFGEIQSRLLRQLYDAAGTDDPWLCGKQILKQAGSQSFTLANVFKRNPAWRNLIVSDGRGSYRMCERFLSSI